ncbi:Ig-like domain repeat protein [Aeromicrobium sp. UC242_57]|uniref:Ig-like domain repeat protein n=1 Tax=Aeromicrobium sp. UC242_57 TaxID=3374624 RepID=UPI0037A96C05
MPEDLGKVSAVSTFRNTAAVVTSDGSVRVWGDGRVIPNQTLTPTDLGAGGSPTAAKDVAVGSTVITVLLTDGRVGTISSSGFVIAAYEGSDITNATAIAAQTTSSFVLLNGGGVIGFTPAGALTNIPAAVTGDNLADPVVDFAIGAPSVAVTQSGAVHTWAGSGGLGDFPAGTVDGKVVKVAASNRYAAALTDENEVVVWGQDTDALDYTASAVVPAEVAGEEVADLVGGSLTIGAIVTVPLPDLEETAKPTIAGTAQVNNTLTGTPATFDGSPDTITNKWLADGTAISGATGNTYKLTAAEQGKNITFESTATRTADSATLVSISTAVGPVAAPPVSSTTGVTAPSKVYGTAGTATVTVTNGSSVPITGTVTLTGAGAAQTKAVVGGKATFALPKTLAPKAYTLSAKYNGSAQVTGSIGSVKYTVAKGKVRSVTFKRTKTPTSKKSGKATVTVTAPTGLAKATGRVTVTIKGKSKKTIRATLSGGKRTITLPKLKKGTYKVTLAYAGDKNYGSAKSKSYTLKIKK